MSFVEWYEDTYREEWNQEYAGLNAFTYKVSVEYEEFCKRNDITPIWNG